MKLQITLISILAAVAACCGIFTNDGPGPSEYTTVRGETIELYGQGIYKHMSSDVAIQGIAQDYVTLFIAIPLLIFSFAGFRKGSIRSKYILTGTTGYLLVTYLFYTAMGMYNYMFLVWVTLLGLTFFTFLRLILSFNFTAGSGEFSEKAPHKFAGGLLVFNSVIIAMLWLSVVLPPLLDGTIYPGELDHYTTLIVQGFDLGLLLPASFITGLMLYRGKAAGFVLGTVYLGFLSLLMTALCAKIAAMAIQGVNVIPAVFIIPSITIITIFSLQKMLKK
ncbi:MAG: hypothetical protein CVT93_03280 [Bacteroidetes bacterium HGW-Bacteroidetes-10]|nr:MAG: hypothetical protein CVT93_03280 [Bacteroidetes bacterium HGW-Bacteroidetes-10]